MSVQFLSYDVGNSVESEGMDFDIAAITSFGISWQTVKLLKTFGAAEAFGTH